MLFVFIVGKITAGWKRLDKHCEHVEVGPALHQDNGQQSSSAHCDPSFVREKGEALVKRPEILKGGSQSKV